MQTRQASVGVIISGGGPTVPWMAAGVIGRPVKERREEEGDEAVGAEMGDGVEAGEQKSVFVWCFRRRNTKRLKVESKNR